MTVTVSHTFNCAIADVPADAAAGKVLPSHWNASHTVANALDKTGDTMTGTLTSSLGALAASAPAIDISQTWNNAAVAFTALKVNVTNTASQADSTLLNLQAGGATLFGFYRQGNYFTIGALIRRW